MSSAYSAIDTATIEFEEPLVLTVHRPSGGIRRRLSIAGLGTALFVAFVAVGTHVASPLLTGIVGW